MALIELQRDIFYSYTIVVPGYNPIIEVNQLTTPGVMSRKNFKFTKTPVAQTV